MTKLLSIVCIHGNPIGNIDEKSMKFGNIPSSFLVPWQKTIEGMKFDFHVCEICGSTIDEVPETPCNICNHPILHYHRVIRPT